MDYEGIDVDAELQEVQEGQIIVARNPKMYLKRLNPLELYSDREFYTKYRMRKEVANTIINFVRDQLTANTNHGAPIPPEIQVLATIRYLAKGAYGDDVAEQHWFSQPTLSRVLRRVVVAIAGHVGAFIKFPERHELGKSKAEFYDIAQCPNIVGAIDCTHIKIKNPGGENPLLYMGRKRYYSLNVQMVCDAKARICDVVARWRGSTHDSRIWNECSLKRRFENGDIEGILIGDNGYACSRYLLTPLRNPTTNPELRYNRAHKSSRNVIERAFGIMKNKFRCFFNGMQISLDTTKTAIVAICIIHNIIINDRLQNGGNESDDDNEDNEDHDEYDINDNDNVGNIFRQQYIIRHFN